MIISMRRVDEDEVIIEVIVEDTDEKRKKEIEKALIDFAKAIFPSLKIESVKWKEDDKYA